MTWYTRPSVEIQNDEGTTHVVLAGDWTQDLPTEIKTELKTTVEGIEGKSLKVDLGRVTFLDSWGEELLADLFFRFVDDMKRVSWGYRPRPAVEFEGLEITLARRQKQKAESSASKGPFKTEAKLFLVAMLTGQGWIRASERGEPRHLVIQRKTANADETTKRELREACVELATAFSETGEGSDDYVHGLLGLVNAWRLMDVAIPLVTMVKRFAQLEISTLKKRMVLSTLVDLKVPMPPDFWREVFDHDPEGLGNLAFSGCLEQNPFEAIDLLPLLPDEKHCGDAAAVVLFLGLDGRLTSEWYALLERLRTTYGRCAPAVRESIRELLEELGAL